jgi:hypothetical protein
MLIEKSGCKLDSMVGGKSKALFAHGMKKLENCSFALIIQKSSNIAQRKHNPGGLKQKRRLSLV